MIPGLGGKYKSVVEIETISKPRQGFRDIEYMKLGLPMAPAVMVGDEIIVQGCEAAEEKVEAAIRRQLNLAEPLPKKL
jgi:hypothetical protein